MRTRIVLLRAPRGRQEFFVVTIVPGAQPRPVLDGVAVGKAITRIAHQIREQHPDMSDVLLVGVFTRGYPLAQRLANELEAQTGQAPNVAPLDITSYRDDRACSDPEPGIARGDLVEGKHVILVDDVLYTGRTVRAALDALVDHGRPASVRLAVLIDRGHRELPIRADYVGKNLPSSRDEEVQVRLVETDGVDEVRLARRS